MYMRAVSKWFTPNEIARATTASSAAGESWRIPPHERIGISSPVAPNGRVGHRTIGAPAVAPAAIGALASSGALGSPASSDAGGCATVAARWPVSTERGTECAELRATTRSAAAASSSLLEMSSGASNLSSSDILSKRGGGGARGAGRANC
jgi:hypothetical protein